eukprot:3931853-Rhodomonas_salina.1
MLRTELHSRCPPQPGARSLKPPARDTHAEIATSHSATVGLSPPKLIVPGTRKVCADATAHRSKAVRCHKPRRRSEEEAAEEVDARRDRPMFGSPQSHTVAFISDPFDAPPHAVLSL